MKLMQLIIQVNNIYKFFLLRFFILGMKVCLANRPGNKSLPEKHSYIVINNFLELFNHFHFN